MWVAIALAVIYFVGVALMAPGRPFGDDIDMAREAAAFGAAKSPGEAWGALSLQHNEHRPVLVRLIFWAAQPIPESARYTLIALVGGLFLVLMFALLSREARERAAPPTLVVALAALMFNFGSAESSLWAMAAVSNFGVLAMTALALWMASRGGWLTWAGLIPALLAVGLQGNGVLAPMLCAWFLLFNARYISAAVWFLAAGAALVWFFWGYVRPIGGLSFDRMGARLGDIVVYVLAFCGSAAAYGGKSLGALNLLFVAAASIIGGLLVAATAWGVARGGLWKGRIELWINLFVIATALLAAVSRVDNGVQQALAPRYHINSCLMIASTLVYFLGPADAPGRIGVLLRRWSGAVATLGLIYMAATAPILVWMHNLYAPVDASPSTSSTREPVKPEWNLDRAAAAEPGPQP
jgi:hypothetical protein